MKCDTTVRDKFHNDLELLIQNLRKNDEICNDCKKQMATFAMFEFSNWFGDSYYEVLGMIEQTKIDFIRSWEEVQEQEEDEKS